MDFAVALKHALYYLGCDAPDDEIVDYIQMWFPESTDWPNLNQKVKGFRTELTKVGMPTKEERIRHQLRAIVECPEGRREIRRIVCQSRPSDLCRLMGLRPILRVNLATEPASAAIDWNADPSED